MLIVLDLEWVDNPVLEIYQFGAVKLKDFSENPIEQFATYVKPVEQPNYFWYEPLDDIKALENANDFKTVMTEFQAWCGSDDVTLVTWGQSDLSILHRKQREHHMNIWQPTKIIDLQSAFSWFIGSKNPIALWRACDYLKIPDCFPFHDALNDAIYTTLVGRGLAMTPTDLLNFSYSEKKLKSVVCPPISKSVPNWTVFNSLQELFQNHSMRVQPCPVCGKKVCFSTWFLIDKYHFMSKGACPDHGKIYAQVFQKMRNDTSFGILVTTSIPTYLEIKAYQNRDISKRFEVTISKSQKRKQHRATWFVLAKKKQMDALC